MSVIKSKWESIKNSRQESTSLVLDSIKFNDYNLIIDENKSTLYYSVINNSKTKYNPNISFNVAEENVKLVILQDEITDEKVQSNYEFKLMIYSKNEYHIYKLVCIDFPILNISYNEKNQDKLKNIQVNMYMFDNLSDVPNRTTISRGKLDKLENGEYKLSLNMMSPGKNKRKNNISIFGMDPHHEYTLLPVDNEEKTSHEHYVELFINNEYVGLYSLEHFKPDNVE